MKHFSKSWKSSKRPNKQRKFRFNAPLHIRGAFLNAHLSKDLRQKYGIRSIRVRLGDRVRIMRGQYKKQEGKVEDVDIKKSKIFISKVEHTKRDGSKARHPIEPSNVLIVELNIDDKKRLPQKTEQKVEPKAAKAEKSVKVEKPVKAEKSDGVIEDMPSKAPVQKVARTAKKNITKTSDNHG